MIEQDVKMFFKKPKQLLTIFTDLEDENLRLIQKCQEAEEHLEEVKKNSKEVMM